MALFGRVRSKDRDSPKDTAKTVGDLFDASELVDAIDALVPLYIESTDRGALVYPACKRKLTDPEGDVRSIWEHTRLEAMRYVTMVPRREVGWLVEPGRQLEMFNTFLRKQPHDKTVVDFTGAPVDDLVLAIVAGLNWLNHCSVLAAVDRNRFSGTLRKFRKIAAIGQQWWAQEGAESRCAQMLQAKEKPPLMLHLIWQDYTMLAKEIAFATVYGPSIERTVKWRRELLEEEFAERPAELDAAIAELQNAMSRFETAREPRDLPE
jgi:hypothetical protein